MLVKAVLFDLIGTTVKEKDSLFINKSFAKAFNINGIHVIPEMVKPHRGKDKNDIITNILNELNEPLDISGKILDDYNKIVENSLDNFTENDGLCEILEYLKERKIITGLGTGLTADIFRKIMQHLNWEPGLFDYTAASEEIGRGRPEPDMILDMMKKFRLNNSELLKVGDTITDIREGKNAGVLTAAILSGTQSQEELVSQEPDYVINSLFQLKDIIN